MSINLDRLQSTLMTSGLQRKDQPLFQTITQLIAASKELQDIVNNLSTNITNNITNVTVAGNNQILLIPSLDDASQDEIFIPFIQIVDSQSLLLPAQTADISATSFGLNAPGLYRISHYLVTSVADGAAGTARVSLSWTDNSGAQTFNFSSINLTSLGDKTQNTVLIWNVSGNIQYSTSHTGAYGTSTYDLGITIRKVG